MLIRAARWFVGLCVASAFVGPIASGCVSEAPCECIRSYGKTNMTSADIKRLLDEGVKACFEHRDPSDLQSDGQCLPTIVGMDARNGKSITADYMCSDVCPDAGTIIVRYTDVSEAECCAAGGIIAKDPAWGGFMGCMPPEVEWFKINACP